MISIHSDGYFGNRVENDISSLNELNEYLQRRMGPVITDLMGPHQILILNIMIKSRKSSEEKTI